jgi:hypothetical protein
VREFVDGTCVEQYLHQMRHAGEIRATLETAAEYIMGTDTLKSEAGGGDDFCVRWSG